MTEPKLLTVKEGEDCARLIAAAPCLLAVCEMLIGAGHKDRDLMIACEKAIAKARGDAA
jgi:hypothetical protein